MAISSSGRYGPAYFFWGPQPMLRITRKIIKKRKFKSRGTLNTEKKVDFINMSSWR
jgi:hypothetical protein